MAITKCTKCNSELRYGSEQVGIDKDNVPVYHKFGYCDKCFFKYDLESYTKKNIPNSGLSIAAILFTIFGITGIVGLILSIVDLCIYEKDKKHTWSIVALVLCVLYFLALGPLGLFDRETENSITIDLSPRIEYEKPQDEEEIILSDKEILFMNIPWGTSFTKVDELHGELGMWALTGDSMKTFSTDEILLGDYKGIDFDYTDINIIGGCLYGGIEIAGYTTQETQLYFAYDTVDGKLPQTEEQSSLYGGRYVFSTENLDGMTSDLKEKITNIYGPSSKTAKEEDIYGNKYTYTFWYGQNETVLVLKTQEAAEDSDIWKDEITLSYAWLYGDTLLQKASDLLKQETLEKEQSNYGSDNTSGL